LLFRGPAAAGIRRARRMAVSCVRHINRLLHVVRERHPNPVWTRLAQSSCGSPSAACGTPPLSN